MTVLANHSNSDKEPILSGRSARARFAILKALDEIGASAGASKISEMVSAAGIQLQARSIRFHLLKMDKDGLTRCLAKHEGRLITESGKRVLARISGMRKVGFIASRMDELGFRMTLDVQTGKGSVIANGALINKSDLSRALHYMKTVFSSGLSMGNRIAIGMWGGPSVGLEVPRGKMALSTICSVTLNGVFLKAGIPVVSRFGGLIEMDDGAAKRFIELTDYQGTSIDPHSIFIKANMTKVGQYVSGGNGIIGASFRDFPSVAVDGVKKLIFALNKLNLNCVVALGQPNRPLLDVPVGEGRTGMIVIDGLNPFAALQEAGIPLELCPLSGLEELGTFVPFEEIAPLGRRSTYID